MSRRPKPKNVMITVLDDRRVRVSVVTDDWAGRVFFLPRRPFDVNVLATDLEPLGRVLVATMAQAKQSLCWMIPAPTAVHLGMKVASYCVGSRCQWHPPFLRDQSPDNFYPSPWQCLAIFLIEACWRATPHLLWKFHSGQVKFQLMGDKDWYLRLSWRRGDHPLRSRYRSTG